MLRKSINHEGRQQEQRYKGSTKLKTINNCTSFHLSIIPLNVNGSISPINIHKVAKWIKKQDSQQRIDYPERNAIKKN